MPREKRSKSEMPALVQREAGMMPMYRRFCQWLKNSMLVRAIRHSRFNPYHMFLKNIKADSLAEAQEKAYDMGKVQFLYRGTRYYAERHDLTVDEEYQKYGKVLRGRGDVSDRIPRDKDGHLDLLAEDPIIIGIMPIEGPALYGHASMQYKDRVINRLISTIYTNPLYETYRDYTEYYYIYPSQLGLKPKDITRAFDKHNIKYGYKKFDLGFNNCSKNIVQVLETLGVEDINLLGPDKLGLRFATPGNNPFGFGVKAWCFKHGVHVHPDEVEQLYARYPVLDNGERRKEQERVRCRYKKITKADIRTQADAEAEKAAKKRMQVEKKKKAVRKIAEKKVSTVIQKTRER